MSQPLGFISKGFLGPFIRVNSEIPNARIFKQTILKLLYKLDSKNICHTFETFFSQIQFRDTVLYFLKY